MDMNDKQKFALSEGKELLKDINVSISKTRDKSWQLLAFILALDFYLLKLFYENGVSDIKLNIVSVICLVFNLYILYNLRLSLFPTGFVQNGSSPEKINKIIEQEKEEGGIDFFTVMKHSYQKGVEKNTEILQDLSKYYSNSLNAIILMMIICVLFIFFFFLFIEPYMDFCWIKSF